MSIEHRSYPQPHLIPAADIVLRLSVLTRILESGFFFLLLLTGSLTSGLAEGGGGGTFWFGSLACGAVGGRPRLVEVVTVTLFEAFETEMIWFTRSVDRYS